LTRRAEAKAAKLTARTCAGDRGCSQGETLREHPRVLRGRT